MAIVAGSFKANTRLGRHRFSGCPWIGGPIPGGGSDTSLSIRTTRTRLVSQLMGTSWAEGNQFLSAVGLSPGAGFIPVSNHTAPEYPSGQGIGGADMGCYADCGNGDVIAVYGDSYGPWQGPFANGTNHRSNTMLHTTTTSISGGWTTRAIDDSTTWQLVSGVKVRAAEPIQSPSGGQAVVTFWGNAPQLGVFVACQAGGFGNIATVQLPGPHGLTRERVGLRITSSSQPDLNTDPGGNNDGIIGFPGPTSTTLQYQTAGAPTVNAATAVCQIATVQNGFSAFNLMAEAAKIPTGAIGYVGGTQQAVAVFVTSITHWAHVDAGNFYSQAAYVRVSTDGGYNFGDLTGGPLFITDSHYTSPFTSLCPVQGPDGYIYFGCFATRGFNMYAARVDTRANYVHIADPTKYQFWDGEKYQTSQAAARAVLMVESAFGFNTLGNQNWPTEIALYWSKTYECFILSGPDGYRYASHVEGPWSRNAPHGIGGSKSYGGFIHPFSEDTAKGNDKYKTYPSISFADPYATFQYEVRVGNKIEGTGTFAGT